MKKLDSIKIGKKPKSQIVNGKEPYIIAYSLSKHEECHVYQNNTLLGAFYPMGKRKLILKSSKDKDDLEVIDSYYERIETIQKQSGNPVDKTGFLSDQYSEVSAVMISKIGGICYNELFEKFIPDKTEPLSLLKNDLILIHNFHARNPLPKRIFDVNLEYEYIEDSECGRLVEVK